MKGTIIKNLKLTKVIDGDTIKIMLDDKEESIRFACLDTEESQHGSDKPVTNAGILASKWVKAYFGANAEGIPSGVMWGWTSNSIPMIQSRSACVSIAITMDGYSAMSINPGYRKTRI